MTETGIVNPSLRALVEGRLLSSRRILLHGDITEGTARELIASLLWLDSKAKSRIELSINSDGGVVPEAFAVIDVIEELRSPVHTIGRGDVCSAALLVFMCGTRRRLSRRASVLSHEPESGEFGRPDDREASHEDNRRMLERFIELYVRYSALESAAEVREFLLPGHDVYLSPEDALRFGLCDELVDPPPKHKPIKPTPELRRWLGAKRSGKKRRRKR